MSRSTARPTRALSLVAAALALVAAVASTGEEEARRVDENGTTQESAGAGGSEGGEPEVFAVGDIVELGDWRVQVHGVTDPLPPADEFLVPPAGQRWVAVDVEVSNVGDQPDTVSSIMCFELADDQNQTYTQTFTGASQAAPPDGDVAAGASRRGTLEYEVPAQAAGLRLGFACDLLSQSSATITLG
jgi:hypothetical protein